MLKRNDFFIVNREREKRREEETAVINVSKGIKRIEIGEGRRMTKITAKSRDSERDRDNNSMGYWKGKQMARD